MTITYGPFDAGAGSAITESFWRTMAQAWAADGVLRGYLNNFEVFADSSGLNVKVKSGGAWIHGAYINSDAQVTKTVAANVSGNPRVDRVVLENDFVANTMDIVIVAGTPAASPSPTALVQSATKWQIPLARLGVANGAASFTNGNLEDERAYVRARSGPEWLNVKDFGATGDGYVDDRGPIQAAIDMAAAAGGGTVFFPRGDYLCGSGGLDCGGTNNVVLRGAGGRAAASGASASRLIYNVGSGFLLDGDGSNGLILEQMSFTTKHAGFGGVLVSLDATGPPTTRFKVRDCLFTAQTTSGTLDALLSIDGCYSGAVEDTDFDGGPSFLATLGLRGNNGTFSNSIRVVGSTFARMASGGWGIWEPGEAWAIINDTFEPDQDGIIRCMGNGGSQIARGIFIGACWLGGGDATGSGSTGFDLEAAWGVAMLGNMLHVDAGGNVLIVGSSDTRGVVIAGNDWVGTNGIGDLVTPLGWAVVGNKMDTLTGAAYTPGYLGTDFIFYGNRAEPSVLPILSVANADTGASQVLGAVAVTAKIEVFDANGTSLGFVPVYTTIT